MSRMRLQAAGLSHPGLVRAENEDSLVIRTEAGLWAVADGMGGLQQGKRASSQAAGMMAAVQLGGDLRTNTFAIGSAIQQANDAIQAAGREDGARGGTTVAVLHILGTSLLAAWVGDSRIYLLRGGRLRQLSRDHSQVQDMLDAGLLSPQQAKHHPRAHVLSRAVGVEADVEVDTVSETAQVGDIFLLCTDGLPVVVDDDEIGRVLAAHSPESAVSGLVELALARGAPDNVTVIAVRCEPLTNEENGIPVQA